MGATAEKTGRGLATILVIAVVAILILSAYSAVSIASLQGQVNSLEAQNNYQQQVLAALGNEVNALQSDVYALTHPQKVGGSISVQSACVSVSAECGNGVYVITILNNGTTTFGVDSSVVLSFKDSTKLTFFLFNTSLPTVLIPNQEVDLRSQAWPAGTNATAKLSPGDAVGISVSIGAYTSEIGTTVLTCAVYTTTSTFTNYTVATTTRTLTVHTCH